MPRLPGALALAPQGAALGLPGIVLDAMMVDGHLGELPWADDCLTLPVNATGGW